MRECDIVLMLPTYLFLSRSKNVLSDLRRHFAYVNTLRFADVYAKRVPAYAQNKPS